MTDETAWVIELAGAAWLELNTGAPHYWAGGVDGVNWTPDIEKAIRFSRKTDADRIASVWDRRILDTRVREHVWSEPARATFQNLRVVTPCPTCGRSTLFVGTGGHLTCSALECPQPWPEKRIEALKGKAEACNDDHVRADVALNLAAGGQVDELVLELNRRVHLRNEALRAELAAAFVGTVRE